MTTALWLLLSAAIAATAQAACPVYFIGLGQGSLKIQRKLEKVVASSMTVWETTADMEAAISSGLPANSHILIGHPGVECSYWAGACSLAHAADLLKNDLENNGLHLIVFGPYAYGVLSEVTYGWVSPMGCTTPVEASKQVEDGSSFAGFAQGPDRLPTPTGTECFYVGRLPDHGGWYYDWPSEHEPVWYGSGETLAAVAWSDDVGSGRTTWLGTTFGEMETLDNTGSDEWLALIASSMNAMCPGAAHGSFFSSPLGIVIIVLIVVLIILIPVVSVYCFFKQRGKAVSAVRSLDNVEKVEAVSIQPSGKAEQINWLDKNLEEATAFSMADASKWVAAALKAGGIPGEANDTSHGVGRVLKVLADNEVSGAALIHLTRQKLLASPYNLPAGPVEVLCAHIDKLEATNLSNAAAADNTAGRAQPDV